MTAILLAAGGAAAFTFFQSIAAQTGVCATPHVDIAQAGTLGATFKAAHSVIVAGFSKFRV